MNEKFNSGSRRSSMTAEGEDWDNVHGITGRLVRFAHDHYYLTFLIFLVFVIVTSAVIFIAPTDPRCAQSGPQFTVCKQSNHDWEVSYSMVSRYKDAVNQLMNRGAVNYNFLLGASAISKTKALSQPSEDAALTLLYYWKDAVVKQNVNIFTPTTVKDMCEIQRLFVSHPFYPKLCQRSNGNCVQPYSVVQQFYKAGGDCTLLTDSEVQQKAKDLLNPANPLLGFFVSSEAGSKGFTNTTRALLSLGAPLPGFKDAAEDKDVQQNIYQSVFFEDFTCPVPKWLKDTKFLNPDFCNGRKDGEVIKGLESQLFEKFNMEGFPKSGQYKGAFRSPYLGASPHEEISSSEVMEVRWYSNIIQTMEFARVVNGDLNFAILSISVVYLYIAYHTKSFFLASMFMFQIIISLPVGYFVYYNIGQIHFYSQVNILAIYLALGIGADSVFVLYDCWQQSETDPSIKTTLGRLNYSHNRTMIACFNTTSSTVMSFVATAITPVMPIECFAIFASLVLIMNYIFMVTVAPAIIMIYYVHFEDLGGFCCYCSRSCTGRCGPKEPGVTTHLSKLREKDALYRCSCYAKVESDTVENGNPSEAFNERELRAAERFFSDHFSKLIIGFDLQPGKYKPLAYFFLAAITGYSIYMATQAFQLTPPKAQEEWFPPNHMFNKELMSRLAHNWKAGANSDYMEIVVVFGVETVDRSNFSAFYPAYNRGGVVFDKEFDFSSKDSQKFFLRVCKEIETLKCGKGGCGSNMLRQGQSPYCVFQDMLKFYNNETKSNVEYFPSKKEMIDTYTKMAQANSDKNNPDKYLEYSMGIEQGTNGLEIKWAMIPFMSSILSPLPNAEAHDIYSVLEKWIEGLRKDAPAGMKTVFQTDTQVAALGWTWMKVEDALVYNLLQGFAMCFPVVFVILIFATGNVIISFYSIVTIAFIVVGVLGSAKGYAGWSLGVAESIAGVIVIGFSVDYTVHLGHMYKEARSCHTKEEKIRYALTYMGTTVVGGGMTTLLAGLMLYLCTLTFFTKMASLLVWTILYSTFYSLFFFTSLCAVAGPVGSFGSIEVCTDFVKRKLRGRGS
uniref:SSD domain-containing protein n=1 Tax=Guillardia theta TaxID=55529 RepID=A0A7S4K9P6_GUITH